MRDGRRRGNAESRNSDFYFREAGWFARCLDAVLFRKLRCRAWTFSSAKVWNSPTASAASSAMAPKQRPSDYTRAMFFSSQPMEMTDMGAVEQTFRMINAETQLLYSSDYPYRDFDPPSRIYDLPFGSEQGKRNILGGNAMRVFNLKLPAQETGPASPEWPQPQQIKGGGRRPKMIGPQRLTKAKSLPNPGTGPRAESRDKPPWNGCSAALFFDRDLVHSGGN
jgi:hypothetical protein